MIKKFKVPSIYRIISYHQNNVQQSYCQMIAKTKTATLIIQKQLEKQKQLAQPISQPYIDSSKTIAKEDQNNYKKKLAVRHLGHYDVFSETFKGQKKSKLQPIQNSLSLPQQYCQLEKQNYRLIQANFNMLKKFSSVMDTLRKQLMRVVQYIEQYHYVQGIKTIYGLLDLIRKIDSSNTKSVSESVRFNKMDNIKKKLSDNNQDQVEDQRELKQLAQNGSVVYQYNIKMQKPETNHSKFSKPLQVCLREYEISVKPQQRLSIDQGLQISQTPYFSQGYKYKPKSHIIFSHQKLLNSFDQAGLHSRVESAKDYGINRKVTQSFYDQIEQKNENQSQPRFRNGAYSQKSIKIFKTNKKIPFDNDKFQELYRSLFIQATTIEQFILQE